VSLPLLKPENAPDDFCSTGWPAKKYKVSRSTIHDHIKKGILPPTTRYSFHYVGWSLAEIEPYLERYGLREEVAK